MLRILLLALALAWASAAAGMPPAPTRGGDLQQQSTPPPSIELELRIFLGPEDVTGETRVTVQKAGERGTPVARTTAPSGHLELTVPAGIYDVQAIREQEGKVVNIRWAERLVVMPYPDEGGHHLEVVNFTSGYGALQIRAPKTAALPDIALYTNGQRDRPAANRFTGDGYVLFVVPAGPYDVQVRGGPKPIWYPAIEVPLDRTRLWLVP